DDLVHFCETLFVTVFAGLFKSRPTLSFNCDALLFEPLTLLLDLGPTRFYFGLRIGDDLSSLLAGAFDDPAGFACCVIDRAFNDGGVGVLAERRVVVLRHGGPFGAFNYSVHMG